MIFVGIIINIITLVYVTSFLITNIKIHPRVYTDCKVQCRIDYLFCASSRIDEFSHPEWVIIRKHFTHFIMCADKRYQHCRNE